MHVRTSSLRSLVTWLITLLLIICPSSYKARPDNLIGPNSFCSGIVSPQRSNARPNFPTSNVVGGAKFGFWFGCKYPQIKAESLHLTHISIASFQIHCGGVQSQNDENCVNVQIFMDLTVLRNFLNFHFFVYGTASTLFQLLYSITGKCVSGPLYLPWSN